MLSEIMAPKIQPDVIEDWLGEGVSMMRIVLIKVDPVIVKVTLTLDRMGWEKTSDLVRGESVEPMMMMMIQIAIWDRNQCEQMEN